VPHPTYMSITAPDGPGTEITPDELRFLSYLEDDKRDSVAPVAPATVSPVTNISASVHNEFHDAFSLLQLEVRFGMRLNPANMSCLQADFERYKQEVAEGTGDVITRLIQIIMIEMLLRGEKLNFHDMSPIVATAAQEPRLQEISKELIIFTVGNTIAVFNDRHYLEPAV